MEERFLLLYDGGRKRHRKEGPLLDTILPETFCALLQAFQPCFTAPSYRNFQAIVAGWVHCLGRRTVTSVALASGALGTHHISVFHRFFARARWTLDGLGQVLFFLALAWVPANQPLFLLLDDTLARKNGKTVSLASMHHDPLLSSARKPFFSFGHVWVVLAVWVPLPLGGGRGFALPVLFRLYTSSKRGGRRDSKAHPTAGKRQAKADAAAESRDQRTKLQLARELIGLAAGWAGERSVYVVADSLYAGRALLERRPANVHLISRLRMDAALWTAAAPRRPGQKGRPRRRGVRLPTPETLAQQRQHWHQLPLQLYGRQVHHPGLPAHRPVVRGAAGPARAHRGGAGSRGASARRSLLLHRRHGGGCLPAAGLCPPLDNGGGLPGRQAAPRV
jgi:hypothetical protein